ncbi:MAG TPA: ATP-binding protein [Candidatus Dormibacteraeota bacterium]|nr:ATP-binding protein [Candidatus Dormibacteraeota bacterium]
MQLRLRTKLTLTTALLVLAVVGALSAVYVARLTTQVIRESNERSSFVTKQIFAEAQHALVDAAAKGLRPESNSAEDTHAYVLQAFDQSEGLTSLIAAVLGYAAYIYEVTIVDRDGIAMVSSDSSLLGRTVLRRPALDSLTHSSLIHQLKVLYGPARVYEVSFPFNLEREPFGEVRVGINSVLLRNEISPALRASGIVVLIAVIGSTLLAAVVSGIMLSPLETISAQLDRISAGQYDPGPGPVETLAERGDELGKVSQKISQVGLQLRGVHEIFSSLRENMNQVMAGLEDGLLLFTSDSRAVMVSPSAQKFLGAPSEQFLGLRVAEIFPPGHPLRPALHLEGDALRPVAAAEAEIPTTNGVKRVGVSVQAIAEKGTRMALVTLRDLDSIETISTQLQVSERLAALGRVTAGVAHEVKNPLNSMRLWLENLKESLPQDQETPKQALQVLDNEIDRLDNVVKRFLNFTRPVELHLEETPLADLLQEVLGVAGPQLERAKIQVATLLPCDVPPVNVDRPLIKQAIQNLVLNAVEAMPEGGKLSIVLSRRGDMAELSVGDTGRGISPEHRIRVFQLFFTTRPGGSGIGLADTFRFVQLHNGSIDFSSEVGRGTTFRIELPLAH